MGCTEEPAGMDLERELERSGDLLRWILENVPDFVVTMTTEGKICFLNRVAEGVGVAGPADVIGESVYTFLSPDSHEAARACFARVIRTCEPDTFETVSLGPHGCTAYYEVRVGPIKHEGKVAALVVIGTDVTRHRQLEIALGAGEDRYRSLVLALDEGVILYSGDGTVQACNASAERILGLTLDQLQCQTSFDPRWHATHEDGSPFPGKDHPVMVTLRTGEPQRNVIMGVHRPDGTNAWISINTQPLVRPGASSFYAIVVSFSDITDHRRALQERERLFREEQAARQRAAFLAEAGEALAGSPLDLMTTLEVVVRLIVPRLGEMATIELLDDQGGLGSGRVFAVAANDPEQERRYRELSRRDGAHSASPYAEVLRTGKPRLFTRADDIPAPSGLPVDPAHRDLVPRLWHRSVAFAPLSARGQLLGLLGMGASWRDLGPDDLDRLVEFGRVAALAIDNARLYQQAQEAVRMRDEFLSIASHELRTPLTAALLNVERLIRTEPRPGNDTKPPAAAFSLARAVQRQVNRLHRLIEELLDISRITGGRLPLEPETVDLGALVAEVADRSAEELRRTRCELTLDTPAGVVGRWDRLRLDQVVTNLLTNALKYGAGTPVRLSITADEATARIAIEDHGIGIAPRDQARIFQRFERAVSDRHYGGFGLGLWITRRIVEAMGGTIRVSSALGEGSTFTVELPRRMDQQPVMDGSRAQSNCSACR